MEKTFNPETFKKTFDAYVLKWHILVAILWILAFLPEFLRLWDSWEPLLGNITFGAIASGIVSIGAVSFGLVSIGAVSFGVIAIGGVSCGIIAIGVTSVGVFAFGNYAAAGLIAISTGSTGISPRVGGKASGIIAIGRQASGLYALSYEGEGKGVYMFSPERQDTEAVALFTRYLRKFKSVILT